MTVDWHEQWALFAQDFHHGKAHISLVPYNSPHTLRLLPGPGFGDLSHPTTQLMLTLMHPHILNQPILDIGTGSGILTLAALLLGARSAIGIDIDSSALSHARANARLNNLKPHFSLTLPKTLPPQNILLLNMIFPEQKIVNPPTLNPHAKLWIVSGILAEQKQTYLQQADQWGWTPVSEHLKDGWMGWIFTCKLPQKTGRFSSGLPNVKRALHLDY